MSGILAKTLHPTCALVGYTIITTLVLAGVLNSSFDMFIAVGIPTCMSGTVSTPYKYTPAPGGGPVPPNAPSSASAPFCTSDAVFNSYLVQFNGYGFNGITTGFTDVSYGFQTIVSFSPFCQKKSNGTCPTFSDQGANTFTVQTVSGSMFSITDANFLSSFQSQSRSGIPGTLGNSFTNYNNYPITFASGSTLPSTSAGVLDSSKTYYVRNFGSGSSPSPSPSPFSGGITFGIAADTTSNPLTFTSPTPINTIKATFPSLGSCASQQNVLPAGAGIPSNINDDGTLKQGYCGYCLTQTQNVGVFAIPGLGGTTITLLLIIDIMMCIPAVRKKGFFRIMVIVVSVLCLIFLIAALAGGYVMFAQVAQCYAQMDFSQAQLMPSPTGASAINGYTPSSGGAPLQRASPSFFQAIQASGSAAYIKPLIVPSTGASLLVAALVFLFVFTIFFSIKTDWTAVSSGGDSGSATMMTPR